MTDTIIKSFFASLRNINKEYLEPSDVGYKLSEEYKQENDFTTINLLRDAYKLLVRAFDSGDGNLDEYANILMRARIRTICKLVITRSLDLIISGQHIKNPDKTNIKNQLNAIYQGLSDMKKELDTAVNNDRLEELIQEWKQKKDLIESFCKKYNFGDIEALMYDAGHGR